MPLRISCRASNNDKHEWDITYFSFHDGKLYSAADDGKIMIWSADLVKLNEVQAHPCSVYCLVIHKDTLWSCSNDGTIKSWDAETLKPIQTLVENGEVEYWQLAILDNCLVAGDDKGNISVYKGDKLYGQINLAEPVKAMIVSDNMIFTVRDLDLVITEIKTEGENVQYGVKKTFMGRAPVTLIGDKLFAYSTREGKEIVINENNIVNNFKYAARITLIEATFKNLDFYNIFKLTTVNQTLLFMALSSALMHMLQNKKSKINFVNFWFYDPKPLKDDPAEKFKCNHQQPCDIYALKGTVRYFAFGYFFSIIKKLIPKMLTLYKKPQNLLYVLVNKDNARFGAFIGIYVGLYRFIVCVLLKNKLVRPNYMGAIAGLLCGTTYAVAPNIQILAIGVTTLLQTFYHELTQNSSIKDSWIPQQIIYMISHGILMHLAIMSRQTCPIYYKNMLNTCTNNLYIKIYNELIRKYILV
ncbi:uncharacterized protein LOC143195515 isoform X2 [Rhynchophorus ferrugineus]|uniref:uncharacterized protein LOC143195515 isoform X2 n=1 Tax=Rhynchophorus ferrugineus TaxID=354439 RepID=UPI003FCD3CDF